MRRCDFIEPDDVPDDDAPDADEPRCCACECGACLPSSHMYLPAQATDNYSRALQYVHWKGLRSTAGPDR